MKNKPSAINYHIDVTPEEDRLFRTKEKSKSSFLVKKPKQTLALTAIVGAHILIAVGLFANTISTPTTEVTKKSTAQEDKAFLNDTSSSPIVNNNVALLQTLNATSTNSTLLQKPLPDKSSAKFTKSYIIKKGDTIYSISRKYKLNSNTLIKINKIKDPNKIKVGQELKFIQ